MTKTVNLWGARFSYVDFLIAYEAPQLNQLEHIKCSFEGGTLQVWKRKLKPAIVLKPYEGKTKIESDIYGTEFTIRLMHLKLKDTNKYFSCFMIYSGIRYSSGRYHLQVYGK